MKLSFWHLGRSLFKIKVSSLHTSPAPGQPISESVSRQPSTPAPAHRGSAGSTGIRAPHSSGTCGPRRGAYQVLDHGFDLFLGHADILRGALQGDPVLALCELDVNLPCRSEDRGGQDGSTVAVPSEPRALADPKLHRPHEELQGSGCPQLGH